MGSAPSIAARRARHEREESEFVRQAEVINALEAENLRLRGELASVAASYDDVHERWNKALDACERWEKRFAGFATEEELLTALTRLHDECSVLDRGNRNVRLNTGPMMAPSEQAVLAARVLIDRAKAASERLREERAS